MRINPINTNSSIIKNTQQKSFKGLWGEERDLSRSYPPPQNSVSGPGWTYETYEKTYYPFQDESQASIQKKIASYNQNYEERGSLIEITKRAIIGATLPILTSEYNLFKQGRLSSDANRVIERTIRTMVK